MKPINSEGFVDDLAHLCSKHGIDIAFVFYARGDDGLGCGIFDTDNKSDVIDLVRSVCGETVNTIQKEKDKIL